MNSFDKDQLAVIESKAKNIVVLAGPGSGKSTTLVGRINYLIDKLKVNPAGIVAITFTNRAGKLLREKLKRPIGFVGTVHSFCYKLIREHLYEMTIIDNDGREALIEQTIAEQRYKGTRKAVDEAFKHRSAGEQNAIIVMMAYQRKLADNGMIDFDGILTTGLQLCKEKDLPYTDLLVDEAQDASDRFKQIYDAMKCERKFYVGDTRQAIFSFLGGNVNNIIEATKSKCTVFELTRNYRSGEKICDAANDLMHKVDNEVNTMSVTNTSGEVYCHQFKNINDEVAYIVKTIRTDQEINPRPRSIAVLLRTNALVDSYKKQLQGYGISVIEKKIVQYPSDWTLVKTVLTLLVNPDNDLIAAKYLQLTRPKEADKIIQSAKLAMTTINTCCLHLTPGMTTKGALAQVTPKCSKESADKLNAAFATLQEDSSIGELLIALSEPQEELTGFGARVTTYHSAKGGEWGLVILPAFEQGTMPISRALKSEDALAEERRLAYVGITRAKETLIFTHCQEREMQWGRGAIQPQQPSQFLREAGLI